MNKIIVVTGSLIFYTLLEHLKHHWLNQIPVIPPNTVLFQRVTYEMITTIPTVELVESEDESDTITIDTGSRHQPTIPHPVQLFFEAMTGPRIIIMDHHF